MKNPLRKRLPRELKDEFGKYLVIFLFMTLTLGLVSGFLVAGKSMVKTYNDSFEEYNIEDGHFILNDEITGTLQNKLEDEEDITVYSLFYKEEEEGEHTYRIYKNREDIDGVSVHKGRIPEKDGEIAIDRKFADSADLKVGDKVTLDKKEYEITGLVALSDYSALFRSNTDLMFDAQNFTVAVVTPEAFNRISDNNLKYCYAWKYDNTSLTDKEKKDKSDDIKTFLAKNAVMTDFVPEPDNQAIHFAGDDMGSDTAMVMVLLYIVIIIMAFIFAVTSISTIEKESTVIGTLRASGYTRKELVIHYMELPMIIMFIGAIIGNILGYTIFKDIVAAIYYNSYSLTVYTTIWSPYAFVMTTIIPCVLMFVINLFMLTKMLKLSPLKFIRRDLKKRKNRKAVKLPEWKFFTRFRTRIIFQNISSYIIMLIGIAFSSIMLLFGLVMQPVLNDYKKTIIDNMPCKYQYILKMPVEIKDNEAEKYAITKLEMQRDNGLNDEFTVYGLNEDSQYFDIDFSGLKDNEIYVSDGVLDKYRLKKGDTITLKEKYEDKEYTYKIAGSYVYPSSLAVFMDIDRFRDDFDKPDTYYSGYFTDNELDIDEKYVVTKLTQNDMTIVADQLTDSMGRMFYIWLVFAVALYMLMVYLLSKIILEKNSNAISIVKILGYKGNEIMRLYVAATAIVVFISLVISVPLSDFTIGFLWRAIMGTYPGWLAYKAPSYVLVEMFVIGVAAYSIIGALQYKKIRKIPMDEALKNVE